MNTDGSSQTQLTSDAANDQEAAWSSDGTKIAFSTVRDGNWEIYVMNADGSGQTNLTNNANADIQPTWSPDGTKIAFSTVRDGNYEIYAMNTDGSGQTNLTNESDSQDILPAWQTIITSDGDPDGDPTILPVTGPSPYLVELVTIIFAVMSASLLLRRRNVK